MALPGCQDIEIVNHPRQRPLLSIVTPCLNAVDDLKRCISNVGSQSYDNIEHIVVDGGSKDGTVEVLESAANIRWISEPDQGQTDALNKGFSLANGEILTWLNADDFIPADSAEAAVVTFSSHPMAGVVYGNLEVLEHGWRYVIRPPRQITWFELGFGNRIGQQGTFFTRDAFAAVGGNLDATLDLAMDFDLWVRFLAAGISMVYVDKILGTFPIHDRSKTGSISQREFVMEEFRVFLKHGRQREAAISLGRAAAYTAEVEGWVSKTALLTTLKEFSDLGATKGIVDRRLIRSAAMTQAAIIQSRHSFLGLRFLLSTGPWRHAETRSKLWRVFRRTTRGERKPPRS